MIVWRISNYPDLAGTGGVRSPGRWHHAGRPVVYTASSPASALLEIIAHLDLGGLEHLPETFKLLEIRIPDDLVMVRVWESDLDPHWKVEPDETRAIGDAWLRQGRSAVLGVPSAIAPLTEHYLINPAHPDAARIEIASWGSYPFDSRLFGRDARR